MRFLTFIASISLATIVFQIALASPIESSMEATEVEQIEMSTFRTNTALHDVEAATNVTLPTPVFNEVATTNSTQNRAPLIMVLKLDSLVIKLLKMRHSVSDAEYLFLGTMCPQYRKLNIVFGLFSVALYGSLGAAAAAAGSFIVRPDDVDLIGSAALKGFNFNIMDYFIQLAVYKLQLIPNAGKNLYYAGLVIGPILSTALTTFLAGARDQETLILSAGAGLVIGFVAITSKLISDAVFSRLYQAMSKYGVRKLRSESSIAWTMIISAGAGIWAAILLNNNWVAGLLMALLSLNPSLVVLLPLISIDSLN